MSPTHDSSFLKMAHFEDVADQKWNSINFIGKKETMKLKRRDSLPSQARLRGKTGQGSCRGTFIGITSMKT